MEELTTVLKKFGIEASFEKLVLVAQKYEGLYSVLSEDDVLDAIKKIIPINADIDIQASAILQVMIRNNIISIPGVKIIKN